MIFVEIDKDTGLLATPECPNVISEAFIAGTDIAQFQDFKAREDGVKYEERLDAVLDRLERVDRKSVV